MAAQPLRRAHRARPSSWARRASSGRWWRRAAGARRSPSSSPRRRSAPPRSAWARARGEAVLIVADTPEVAARVLGALRVEVADAEPEGHDVFWVVDFPMFERNDRRGALGPASPPVHRAHRRPRRRPRAPGAAAPTTWSSTAGSWAAARSGSTRPSVQQKVFDALGIGPEEARERFGFLLEALALRRAAARRHRVRHRPLGGAARGRATSIRDVIAFPKAASGADPLTGAPAPVDERQLRELGRERRSGRPAAPDSRFANRCYIRRQARACTPAGRTC